MLKINKRIKIDSPLVSFLISLGVCVISVGVISFVAALLANLSSDPTAIIGICSLASLLISAVVSGFATVKIKKDAGALYVLAVGLSAVLIMVIICLFSGGEGIGASALMNYACYLGAFILSSLLSKRSGNKRRHRFSRR